MLGYDCECNGECGLKIDIKSWENMFKSKEYIRSKMSILHPDCKHLKDYKILIQKEDCIAVAYTENS